jgi:hypothetical protein
LAEYHEYAAADYLFHAKAYERSGRPVQTGLRELASDHAHAGRRYRRAARYLWLSVHSDLPEPTDLKELHDYYMALDANRVDFDVRSLPDPPGPKQGTLGAAPRHLMQERVLVQSSPDRTFRKKHATPASTDLDVDDGRLAYGARAL